MKVERRPLSSVERGVLQERLQPTRSGCGGLFCSWFLLPSCCGGLAFAVGAFCIGYPLAWMLDREFSKSPLSWAGHGPGYGLLILTLLALLGTWLSWRLDDERLRGRIRKDLTGGEAEILRATPMAAVIARYGTAPEAGDSDAEVEESLGDHEDEGTPPGPHASGDGDDAHRENDDADLEAEEPLLRVYLRIAPTEVLILEDPNLAERRRAGFPHVDIEFAWGPRSRVLLGIADEGATLDDVVEIPQDELTQFTKPEHGALLIYPEPTDTLLALLATEPSDRRRLWEQGSTANTLTRRLGLRR